MPRFTSLEVLVFVIFWKVPTERTVMSGTKAVGSRDTEGPQAVKKRQATTAFISHMRNEQSLTKFNTQVRSQCIPSEARPLLGFHESH